ncbi:MAG: glucoamylase family protein [Anaerolineaceae bacterium]
MAEPHENQNQDSNSRFPEKSAPLKTGQTQGLVDSLVHNYQEIKPSPLAPARNVISINKAVSLYESWLAEAHTYFREASNREQSLTLSSEWLLDNYYIIRQSLRQIREDMPGGFYNQLPKLADEPMKDFPRIYAIGRTVLSSQNYLLNIIDLQAVLTQYQEEVPLRMNELWALPIFLRFGLIETLAYALKGIIHPENSPRLPVLPLQLAGFSEPFMVNQQEVEGQVAGDVIPNVILSLRTISEQNWNVFFEAVSCLERTLRKDPSGIYCVMDFKTRDLYRKEIEKLSLASGREENELGEITINLAKSTSVETVNPGGILSETNGLDGPTANSPRHVGEFLIGRGRPILEEKIGYRPGILGFLRRWGLKHAVGLYLGNIFFLTALMVVPGIFFYLLPMLDQSGYEAQSAAIIILGVTMVVPILTVAATLINWLVTLWISPRILPKLNFKDEIPANCQTLVVIPAMITSHNEVENLVRQLEMHYLRNPEPGLRFALLTDFRDAESETLPEDNELIEHAVRKIAALNEKYGASIYQNLTSEGDESVFPTEMENGEPDAGVQSEEPGNGERFYLLHRKRLWNPSEEKWMGWERKRGKLHELNEFLRGAKETSFSTINAGTKESRSLQCIRYVITLDSDTILPRGAARRLIGTLAHPLNQARFDEKTGKVISGYTVLQPRMEVHPRSSNHSLFTRIFTGNTGLDLYTLAVSDAYQDLFGEGNYVGKGIYDVDSFERSIGKRIPENSVLSHDLLEGIMGSAGLVTDITMIEDYPPNYFVQTKRAQRWIRGDWQLLPWLIRPGKFRVKFSTIDRWKLLDNLLRSLFTPALLGIFILGMMAVPDLAWFWMVFILISLGIPLLTSMARSTLRSLGGENITAAFHSLGFHLTRWALALAFLPYDAFNVMDAILTTLHRLLVSHRDLLQWTTAAETANIFRLKSQENSTWFRMAASTLLVVAVGGGIQWMYGFESLKPAPAMVFALPILLLWMFSPLIAVWINKPITRHETFLSDDQEGLFRQVARRTWGFFERFVGPEDHWLPPDHFQESPAGIIAHQTSPSNIGLLLTSTLAAYDFGYLDQLGLAARLSTTMSTLEQLERFQGHFLNWYDTLTLQPLNPRYVSTVDSGNLAASLIVTAQAGKSIPNDRVFRWDQWQGYLDTLSNLTETLMGMQKPEFNQQVEKINNRIGEMRTSIMAVKTQPGQWFRLFQTAKGEFWQTLSGLLTEMVRVGRSAFDLEALRKLQEVSEQVERHHLAIERTITDLVPWVSLLEQIPERLSAPQFIPLFEALRFALPYNPVLSLINDCVSKAQSGIDEFHFFMKKNSLEHIPDSNLDEESKQWLEALEQVLVQASKNSDDIMETLDLISSCAEQFVMEMDFKFLFHPERRVFHIGYNLEAGLADNNYYDLLASEARIASIIALAKGEVPPSHWLQLNRPLTRVEGEYVLLSWNATMFEYLMPPLFLRSFPGTLLAESARGAVLHQIAYGKSKGVPWGVSESGYFLFDANQNYQYRAFGVPGLGFKRGLSDDLVIAPYASMMAVGYDPEGVAENLVNLMALDGFGLYGLYEAIDFTANRLLVGESSIVVREYMAHHQGMILMALVNYFHKDVMVRRMHSSPRIQSVELLLQEQIPQSVPIQNPYAENVKGLPRLTTAIIQINPWSVPVRTAIPQVNLLSNGNYSVLISNSGSGYSSWRGVDLTRWQADGVLDPWGSWVYIQDLNPLRTGEESGNGLWSAGTQPIPSAADTMQVTFFAHMAVFRRIENGVSSTMEVTVSPNDPVEIRRIHLQNTTSRVNHLRLTSYGEVILTQHAADNRHPAFNKLFIESEFVPELNLQIFTRRPRSDDEKPIFLGHMLVVERKGEFLINLPVARHESDRQRFIGRGRDFRQPAALFSQEYLTGTTGATLDPIFALGLEVKLNPQEHIELAYLTLVGETREEVLALARRYRRWSLVARSFLQADLAQQAWLGRHDYDSEKFKNSLQVLSALIYPSKTVRASSAMIASNRLDQSGLWRFGISGDFPILLVELDDPQQVDLIVEVLQVYDFLRSRRFLVDVVILNHQQTNYGAELNGMLFQLVSRLNYEQWLNKRGGIFILYADQIHPDEYALLQTAGRFIFNGGGGSMEGQMPEYPILILHLPEFIPTRTAHSVDISDEITSLNSRPSLQFFNGYGGFSQDGREYIIDLPAGRRTPAPWVNVIGYPHFGFMVSETGSQTTWSINSGENRLTPWLNDPVTDPSGEVLYMRDEETGEVWTPTPLPGGVGQSYRVTHGAGYSTFEHYSHGLLQKMTVFASPEDPVKIIHLRVENTWDHTRRITATQYIEWVLGTTHADAMSYIIPEFETGENCLLATNPFSREFGKRTAFLIASKPLHGLTADRTEFLGRNGDPAIPAALHRLGLETRLLPGEDPCGVLQLHLDLLPGGVEEIYFVLGQGDTRDHALELARKYHDSVYVGAALEKTHVFWEGLLGKVQVHTPEPAADLILNRWMLYQSLSCRVWGRSAFYQPSGAFGFRDQLQDVLALAAIDPAITRSQILNAARHQFSEGDVMHWWHPPTGRGVRTRISDDLLWLPYVTAAYIEASGDMRILEENIPFLEAPPLKMDEMERYNEYPQAKETSSLMEHCRRAIEKGTTTGPHELPLIGTGDWNDGMNLVGEKGRGESVWLAWFLCDVLERFAGIYERLGESEMAQNYRARGKEYAAAVERSAWDGDWYLRAFYDDGSPLGSRLEEECQIDAIAQSWSLLSGAGDPVRSRQAMEAVFEQLVRPSDQISLLFTPPFDKIRRSPGYIKGYIPGIRENGGQYTHAAIWTAWAFASLGDGARTGQLFNMLNPILHSRTREKADEYRVEPYVISADIYSQPPFLGRGGWSWYTGSASWMYQLGLTAMLGFQKVGNSLRMNPVIPPDWDGFEIRYRFGEAVYEIRVSNPEHLAHGLRVVKLDGADLADKIIPLVDDGTDHLVEVVMGEG